MALMITDECIACDACLDECPTAAIEEGDPIYIIDPDRCVECVGFYDEPSCVSVCPVDCIIPDPDNVENPEELKYKLQQIQDED